MRTALAVAFAVVCSFLLAGLIVLVSSPPRGDPVALLPAPTPAPLVVHVAGQVLRPGIYTLPRGSRVIQALDAAGGVLPGANPDALNLAAVLEDGQRVYVAAPTNTPAPAATRTISPPTADANHPLNINLATQAEFDTLPGIGPVTAGDIIAYRNQHGPFKTVDNLLDVPGIGPGTLAKIKDLVTVGDERDEP